MNVHPLTEYSGFICSMLLCKFKLVNDEKEQNLTFEGFLMFLSNVKDIDEKIIEYQTDGFFPFKDGEYWKGIEVIKTDEYDERIYLNKL